MADAAQMTLPSSTVAWLTPDPFVAGALTLSLDGVPQSHVSVRDPRHLFYDYVRRMGTAIDLAARPAEPLDVLHLGAGALTLARYVAETRPTSRQLVVEKEVGLVAFVLEEAPLPRSADLDLVEGDALEALRSLALPGSAWREGADVVVCDVYAGVSTPAHLISQTFFEAVRAVLAPGGTVLVNVADEPDLGTVRRQIDALSSVFPVAAMIGPAALLDGREAGNAVLLAGTDPAILERMPALAAAGPHPVAWRVVAPLQ
ncbi:fused MFS/spermidine synthase [Agreia sp. PsM10]|uniref:spermidine synthase n=1 Tax=Agreia sp. PsM10 TaxID=3030533 RepID=UPI00263B3D41|nr:fused MFS/spermidine synthase [Agreia sp. PsM10]MDN4641289.1 fused MFS/spermidine synthase [Agreia sp. PsM10]